MSKKTYKGQVGRGDTINVTPEELEVITDPKHPLYDPRVEREPNEALILSIMRNGIIVPLVITPDGDKVYVTDGRQRRAAAIEANKRLKKEGGRPVVCPCVWRRGDEKKLYEIQVTTNALRHGDSALESARKMSHLLDLNGGDRDATALAFGVTQPTLKAHLALLDCAPAVQKAVESGKVAATIATKLAKLPKDEQVATLDKMIETGATKGQRAHKAVEKKGDVAAAQRVLSRKQRRRLREVLQGVAYNDKDETIMLAEAVLAFIDGDASTLERWPHLDALAKEVLGKDDASEKEAKVAA